MCHTCMSPSTTRVLVPKFVGVWILLCSSVGVGAGGAVGAGRGVAGGIGVGAGGGSAHATIASNRQAASSTTTPKFLCDSMNSPSSNSSQRILNPEAIIDPLPQIPIESWTFPLTSLRVKWPTVSDTQRQGALLGPEQQGIVIFGLHEEPLAVDPEECRTLQRLRKARLLLHDALRVNTRLLGHPNMINFYP